MACLRRGGKTDGSTESLAFNASKRKSIIQIYTDWANHYLDRGRYKRNIQDLQVDVCDGVLLADVIEAVIGTKVPGVSRKPKNAAQMVDNITSCLSYIGELGVSVEGVTSKDVREGNLKVILSLFFNLSRFKQAQKNASNNVAAKNSANASPTNNSLHTVNQAAVVKSGMVAPSVGNELNSKLPSPFRPNSNGRAIPCPNNKDSIISTPSSSNPSISAGSSRKNKIMAPSIGQQGLNSSRSGSPHTTPSSFIPQPKAANRIDKNRSRPSSTSSTSSIPHLPVKSSANNNNNSKPRSIPPSQYGSNSMLDKFKLFNPKNPEKNKSNKRTSSSSGFSSARSERSDSSNSLCSGTPSPTSPTDNPPPKAANHQQFKKVTSFKPQHVTKSKPSDGQKDPISSKLEQLKASSKIAKEKKHANSQPSPDSPLKFQPSSKVKDKSSSDVDTMDGQTVSSPNSSIPKPTLAVKGTTKLIKEDGKQRSGSEISLSSNGSAQSKRDGTKLSREDIYVAVHIAGPDTQVIDTGQKDKGDKKMVNNFSAKSTKPEVRGGGVSIAMVSPIISSGPKSSLEEDFKSSCKSSNRSKDYEGDFKSRDTTIWEEGEDALVNIQPMQPLVRASPYGYVRGLGPRARLQPSLRIHPDSGGLMFPSGVKRVDYGGELSSGYMSDGEVLRPSPVTRTCALEDMSGYMSEGGTPLYSRRTRDPVREQRIIDVLQDDRNKMEPRRHRLRNGFDDSSSVSSGVSDTFPELNADESVSSVSSNEHNVYASLKRNHKPPKMPNDRPRKEENSSAVSGKSRQAHVKKTDSSMQTDTSAFHHSASWKKYLLQQQQDAVKSRKSSIASKSSSKSSSKHKLSVVPEPAAESPPSANNLANSDAKVAAYDTRVVAKRSGALPQCGGRKGAKVKVCGSTQTTDIHSEGEAPSRQYFMTAPGGLRDYVVLGGRGRLLDNYASLEHHWMRHSPSCGASVARGGSLTEADSMESLSSTSSSIHAQIQHARANSLTHARLMLHQRELSSSPRLSRSNSIRSTKSEKLSSYMLQRSSDDPTYATPTGNAFMAAAIAAAAHNTSQPTSPSSAPQGGSRYNMYPLSPGNSVPTSSSFSNHTGNRGSSMSPYMTGLLSKMNSKDDDMHGSALSLVSTSSSIYSTAEEKQAHEIRKLKRELDQAHEKVATLTSQLTTNAHMVAAFEQSLSNMTNRLQHLTASAEQKDSELGELRQTIDALKQQSAEAGLTQAALQSMQAVQRTLQEQRISRQFSTDSMSSVNSCSSACSGNSGKSGEDKKKKKKGWLRNSFSKAFSRSKKNKHGSVSDVEDIRHLQSDSSTPNSPLLSANNHTTNGMKQSHSSSALYEKDDEDEEIGELKKQLHEKDMMLTDIRLDALSSAHQLENLKETLNKMRSEMQSLKQDNDRLQRLVSSRTSNESLDKRLSDAPSSIAEIYLNEPRSDQDGKLVNVSVYMGCHGDSSLFHKHNSNINEVLIGNISISSKTKWDLLDNLVKRSFKDYVLRVDPVSNLGLNADSIVNYHVGEIIRIKDLDTPELLPCGYIVGDNMHIRLVLKGTKQHCVDALSFESLIPKSIVQRYISLLTEHRRIILCGPSGTGKTYTAHKLAEYLVLKNGKELVAGAIATFSVDHKSAKELRQYLSNVAEQCETSNVSDLPTVIILDNLHHVGSLGEVFNGFLSAKYQKCPYIIGTMNQATCSTTNLQLHHNFRWVLCANHMEPVKGFLSRFLKRKLLEEEVRGGVRNTEVAKVVEWMPKVWHHLNQYLETHSSSDVTIGPRLFLSCPVDLASSQVWFTDLWNYSIVPYVLEAVREGLQLYGRRAPWEDPAEWVHETYPWPVHATESQLLRLRPEDVGYEGHPGPTLKNQHTNNTSGEADPLLNMLMRLQEAASYSSPHSNDSDTTSLDSHGSSLHSDDILNSGLESTL